jgi:hypothetical protein
MVRGEVEVSIVSVRFVLLVRAYTYRANRGPTAQVARLLTVAMFYVGDGRVHRLRYLLREDRKLTARNS